MAVIFKFIDVLFAGLELCPWFGTNFNQMDRICKVISKYYLLNNYPTSERHSLLPWTTPSLWFISGVGAN